MPPNGIQQGRLTPSAGGPWSLTGALTFDTVPQLWSQGGPLLAAAAAATTEVDQNGLDALIQRLEAPGGAVKPKTRS